MARVRRLTARAVGMTGWALAAWLVLSPSAQVDRGGLLRVYAAKAQTHDGPLPRRCMSACTMLMLRGCVTPGHVLVFHLPSRDTPYWRGVMAAHYPAPIADWFMDLPPDAGAPTITGAEAIRHGARAC